MAVGGKTRETASSGDGMDFTKKVGFFEANVIAINPTNEEFKSLLDIELKEDSTSANYLSVASDGTAKIRIDVWLEDVKTKDKLRASFWLEDNKRINKDGTKKQYVNSIGVCSWAADEDGLPTFFTDKGRDYRVAYIGEEEFVTFLRTWLGGLDYKDESTELMLDWKKVIAGNLREWKELIGCEWTKTVGAMATIRSVEKEGEVKSYQGVYNKAFFPGDTIRHLRNVDYNNEGTIRTLNFKKRKDLKMHERFVVDITGEYGCKDFYTFKELHDYDPEKDITASDKVFDTEDSDY